MKILVVDDKADNRYLLEVFFKTEGHEVVTASNGMEALEKLGQQPVDLILSDILMPKMDGYRLCRECKQNEALKAIPFVFITAAYTEQADEAFARDLGSDRFIRRPIDPDELLRIIEEVILDRREGRSEPRPAVAKNETRYLAEYSGRVISQLEQNIQQLEIEIAERKRAEQALSRRAEEVERLLEIVPAAIFVANDPACRTITGNRLANRLFEATYNENVSASSVPETRRYYGPDGREITADELPMQIATATNQEVRNVEMVVRSTSGLTLSLLGNAVPLRDEHGGVRGCIGAFIDITERKRIEAALRRNEAALQEAQRIAHLGSWELDAAANTVTWSEEMFRIFDWPVREGPAPLSAAIEATYLDDRNSVLSAVNESLKMHKPFNLEYRIVRPDGSLRWIHARSEVCPDETGKAVRLVGTALDITERKQTEDELRLAASVFTHAREGIMITDADGSIIDVNDAFSDITGYSREELLGQNPRLLSSGLQEKEFYEDMWRDLVEQGHWHGELWNRHKNGDVYPVMQTISAVRDEQGNIRQYMALYTDITLLKAHEQQLERSAHYDALTSLPNRVLLSDRLNQGMIQTRRREQRLAVVFIDLDGFKAINDNHGHEAGDHLLITLSIRMKQALREGDTLARLGGDEFVAVLLDLNGTEASAPFTHLLAAAAEPVQFGEITLQVSASLGITFYPQAEDIDADQLLRQADQAMYQAKLAGKNRYHLFDAEHDRSIRGRYESLERIRNALAAGEFVLHYQPKVNMREGRLIGAEALIRWQHPEKGLLLPDLFLPEIEDHKLAIDIGEWVIDTALSQMEIWQAAGLNIPVSVNIGSRQLQQTDFVERLCALLAAHPNVSPSDLQLEILETYAMKDLPNASLVIDACRKIGVSFALDDFGTGYSSLTYLKHLPVAQLKIDKSFVHDMVDNLDDLSIVEGVIGLASAFRLLVIAEGAETVEHSTILLQLGCDLAQGYGIAHPMPACQLPGWEATWQPDSTWINLSSVSRVDLPLLFANVEHRSWIIAMEKYLTGEREVRPTLDIHQCRFGQWLNTEEGIARFGAQPSFEAVDLLHRQVHDLAVELCKLKAQGSKQEALARLRELHDLRDALLEQLRQAQQN